MSTTARTTFKALSESFIEHLNKLERRPGTIEKYYELWNRMKIFLKSERIKYYDKSTGDRFLRKLYGDYDYRQLKKHSKTIVNSVQSLWDFYQTGSIPSGPKKHPVRTFKGAIGETIENFINDRKINYQLCNSTLHNYRLYLHGFYAFLVKKSLKSINGINEKLIIAYINSENKTIATRHNELLIIKKFLQYLFRKELTSTDFSEVLPKDNYRPQPLLPSTFSTHEIEALLKSIDRGSPKGKRDYAIILLATKLGLRSSDIVGLKLDYILWEKNLISFVQRKTQKSIKLPLLPEVGNAIIDYLKYGRPKSKESFCFLQIQSPFSPLKQGSLGNVVLSCLGRSGINYKNRRHGPHALRHILAGKLLNNGVPITTISDSLGHAETETTMFYLRIDIKSLRQCALDVPPVASSFYNQK